MTRWYKGLSCMTRWYKGLSRMTRWYKGLSRMTRWYKGLSRMTRWYKGLSRMTRWYKGLSCMTRWYKGLWRQSFTHSGPAAVDVDEWLASHPHRIMYSIQWAGGWVDTTAILDTAEKRSVSIPAGTQYAASLALLSVVLSLYQLSYTGSYIGRLHLQPSAFSLCFTLTSLTVITL